ncbi:hypothetical protein KAZ82_00755 [Candidatus Babeliales bacterium]|nr:hypothetical protein [Candidatus Babeliales bacterium]
MRNIRLLLAWCVLCSSSLMSASYNPYKPEMRNGVTALMQAVIDNELDDVALFSIPASDEDEVNLASANGFTAIMFSKTPEMLQLLLERGGNINAVAMGGFSLLLHVTMQDNECMMWACLKAGARIPENLPPLKICKLNRMLHAINAKKNESI